MSRPTSLHIGGTLYWVIRLFDPSDGVTPIDADSTPTVAIRKNGSSTGDSVTVTKRSATTGIYDCSYNPASEVEGDKFTVEESATISATAYPNSWEFVVCAVERGTDGANTTTPPTTAQIEAALLNEGDGQALIDAIIQAIDDADIEADLFPALIGSWILDRVVAGNHDTAGTVGKLLQNLDALISSRLASAGYTAPDNAGISTAATQAAAGATSAATAATQATTAATNTGTILARLGAWTGTGLNTILGAFRAMWNKTAGLTPSDLTSGIDAGDQGDSTTESLKALRAKINTISSGGGGAVTILPIVSTVGAGEVSPTSIIGYESRAGSWDWTVYDSAGNAIDLSGTALRFRAYRIGHIDDVLFELTSADDEITVGGASSNIVTVTAAAADQAEPGQFGFVLDDIDAADEPSVLAHGDYTIKELGAA